MIELIRRVWRFLKVKYAISHAKKMHASTRKQYYVIQVYNVIRVYDRQRIDLLIRQGILDPRLSEAHELRKVCLYYTKTSK